MPQAVKDSNDSIPAGISLASHTQLWSKMKEQTSAGPSRATFAHFIAGSTDPIIAVFDATMRDIPYRTGMSPTLWHHGTNVMLQKKKDNVRVDTLRAILLYKAAFNANNKTLGREMMYYAEQLKVIAKNSMAAGGLIVQWTRS
jgi:hypothetical protein